MPVPAFTSDDFDSPVNISGLIAPAPEPNSGLLCSSANCYTSLRRIVDSTGCNMRRSALIALSQFIATIAFCQTPMSPSSGLQSLPDESFLQPQFSFNSGQLDQGSPSSKLPKSSYFDRDETRGQTTTLFEVNHEFQIPPMNLQLFALNAQNSLQIPPPVHGRGPRPKSIPIPTEWPNAKPEPIPTTWANLK